jgi:hypothetical protein
MDANPSGPCIVLNLLNILIYSDSYDYLREEIIQDIGVMCE